MFLRFEDNGSSRSNGMHLPLYPAPRSQTRSERVQEIRQRIANDAYRSADVVEEIARRILVSREL